MRDHGAMKQRAGFSFAVLLLVAQSSLVRAGDTPASPAPPAAPPLLYAVEFRTGPRWDPAKAPHEQAHFKEHSSNLKRLRDDGRILFGARYSDKGLVVLGGATESEVRALVESDPSVQGGTFSFEIHEFMVFYPGCVTSPGKSPKAN